MKGFTVFLAFSLMASGSPFVFAQTAAPDTLEIYGGPGTLEGKFQTELGEPDAQGWVGVDESVSPNSDFWSVATLGAANLDPQVPGNHAWWCGSEMAACSPTDSSWGYGNDWNTAIGTARTIDPTILTHVHLTGDLNINLEPGYDFLKVEAITATGPVLLMDLDGLQTGYGLYLSFTYEPGDYVGDAGDEVQVRLRMLSDSSWSDEDCSIPGAGGVQADNLTLAISQPGLADYPEETETCEPGDPLHWGPAAPPGLGNFAQLWTGLDDMDPDQDNASPQWAFLNDGIIVPELDPSYCWDKCYGPDSLSIYYGDQFLRNSILSPAIALPIDWTGTLRLAFDAYVDPATCAPAYLNWGLQTTADPAGATGWVETWYDYLLYAEGPAYRRMEFSVDAAMVPAATRHVRIKLLVYVIPVFCWGPQDSPAPYLDNVRLQLAPDEGTSDVPEVLGLQVAAVPNPFNPAVVISWSLPEAADLRVDLYDIRGRRVRLLRDGPAPAGPGQVTWTGADDREQLVASGVYFCRIRSGSDSRMLKLTLTK